jgi:hypothetical protein
MTVVTPEDHFERVRRRLVVLGAGAALRLPLRGLPRDRCWPDSDLRGDRGATNCTKARLQLAAGEETGYEIYEASKAGIGLFVAGCDSQ